jgi:hypothetical protein
VECAEKQEHSQHKAEVANAIDDERFFARVGCRLFQKIKANQQVAAKAHTFPSDEEQHVVRGHHQDEHEEHEQVQVGEETVVPALVRHVAGRIDVDEEAHTGDDHQHDYGELIDLQIEAGAEIAGNDPVKIMLWRERQFVGRKGEKFADRFQREEKRKASRAKRDAVDDFVWPLAAQQAVDGRAK